MIDLARARELLARAVATQGRDFLYSEPGSGGCYYVPLTEENIAKFEFGSQAVTSQNKVKTGCLIGVALDLSGETRHHYCTSRIETLYDVYPDMMTCEAMRYFDVAQTAQDAGKSWGVAYDRAEASLQGGGNAA